MIDRFWMQLLCQRRKQWPGKMIPKYHIEEMVNIETVKQCVEVRDGKKVIEGFHRSELAYLHSLCT